MFDFGQTMIDTGQLGEGGAAGRVLVVDDDPDVLKSASLLLRREGFAGLEARDPAEAWSILADQAVDVVLLDLNFERGATSGEEGFRCLREMVGGDPDAVVVVVTGHSGINIAVAAMRAGASDFVMKPWSNERLAATLRTAVELRRSRRRAAALRRENAALTEAVWGEGALLLGRSAAAGRLRELLGRAGPTEANVLILGEKGSGKTLAARAVHRSSARHAGPFVPVDLSATPEEGLEAELFGDLRGGADRTGAFVAAQGGTLLLEDVGSLAPSLQLKLARALERRQVTPIGADRAWPTDVRVISTTHLPREDLRRGRALLEELLQGLNTVEIVSPPLRERDDDVILLAEHFLRLYGRRYGRAHKPLSPEAERALKADRWPGNVRALRHAAERAVILSELDAYRPPDFGLEPEPSAGAAPGAGAGAGGDLNLARSERALVEAALKRHHYNVSHAARDLGLTRAALYRRMEKHGL